MKLNTNYLRLLAVCVASCAFPIAGASAASPGCAAAGAFGNIMNGTPGADIALGGVFSAGDVLNFEIDVTGAVSTTMPGITVDELAGTVHDLDLIGTNAVGVQTFTYDVPIGGTYDLRIVYFINPSAPGDAATGTFVGCTGGSSAEDSAEDTAVANVAQTTVRSTVGFISNRINEILSPTPSRRSTVDSTPRAVESDAPSVDGAPAEPLEGGAGQGADRPWGVWANFGWNGISNSERVNRSDTDVITGVVGADTIYDDDVLLGLAVVLSHAMVDTPTDTFSLRETSITFAPYAAYAISEDISVDASFGYGVGVSSVEKTQGTITGDGVNHRYFLSANGTYRNYWGDFGFTGKTGVLWAQNFQGAYDNSDGTRTGSARSDMLSFDLEAKPSYIFYFDDFALEPYIGVDYTYDAYMTDVQGTANDPDQMTFLAGLSVFAGSIYGSIDFERAFFRENQDRTAVSATLRIQF